jgi:hypothetical protein
MRPERSLVTMLADFGGRPAAPSAPLRPVLPASAKVETPVAACEPEAENAVEPMTVPDEAESLRRRVAVLEAELALARSGYGEERERLVAAHRAQLAEKIEAGVADAGDRLVRIVGDTVAAVLEPILTETLARRSVDALCERLRAIARPGAGLRLRLTGSRALFDTLAARLSARDWVFDFTEGDDVDLSIEIDSTIIETRLGAWAALIAGDVR